MSGDAPLTRNERRLWRKMQTKRPPHLVLQPESLWPANELFDSRRFAVWRSSEFLVQAFREEGGIVRLSVNRVLVRADRADRAGNWVDGIAWDQLQEIKRQAGYGDRFAVEVYPEDACLVNLSNMRHLWVYPEGERAAFAWER